MIVTFADAFSLTCGLEGDSRLSLDKNDPGNWTGGRINSGKLVGSKYGISAAAFPNEDIQNMSYSRAMSLAKGRYWDVYNCDQLPMVIGWLVFDTAYNGGRPAQWLQNAVGVKADGVVGAVTVAAVRASSIGKIALRFLADREDYWAGLDAWSTQGKGWIHRGTGIMRIIADSL